MTKPRPITAVILALSFNILLLPTVAAAQTFLVDTGPGSTSTIGASTLFASGSTTYSPQPQCSTFFQFLGGQFTLPQAAAIDSIQAWMGPFGLGGRLAVKIREDLNGLPSASAPPLFSPGSIFSKTYDLPNRGGSAGWVTFDTYEAVLAAGTYWVTFEADHL